MKDQRAYKANLFASVAQSNFIGVGFGLWLGLGAPDSSPVAAALVFLFWMAASWWVWLWTRRKFWPEDFH